MDGEKGRAHMLVDFNKVFRKTKEEEIKMYEDLLQMYKNNESTCRTCVHYIYHHEVIPSGIYTVYVGKSEDCDLCPAIFTQNINRKPSETICPHYEYDKSRERIFRDEIRKIKER